MSIVVIGINHRTASVTVREKVFFALDKIALYLQDLLACGYAQEGVLISTCNRSELYCYASDIELIREWFCAQTSLSLEELKPALYIYRDADAVAHIMQVACGLDSMILGEPQILGQMKEAFSESCAAGAVDALFHRLFQHVFSVAKEIRTATAIGACPVSVASAAMHFAKLKLGDLSNKHVVFIGAGETTELLLRYLQMYAPATIAIVNRTVDKALALTQNLGGKYFSLDEMEKVLVKADVVFSATGSAIPLVTKSIVASAMQARSQQTLLCIDVAVPRDIEAAVSELENVQLFCIDDLKEIIEKNRQGREHAAEKAREMINKKSLEFITEFNSHAKVTHTIRAYRNQIEMICHAELIKAKQQLHQGEDAAVVLDLFAHAFTKKLLHTPSVQMRNASVEGRLELLKVAKQLFAIPDSEIEYV